MGRKIWVRVMRRVRSGLMRRKEWKIRNLRRMRVGFISYMPIERTIGQCLLRMLGIGFWLELGRNPRGVVRNCKSSFDVVLGVCGERGTYQVDLISSPNGLCKILK